MSSFADLGLPSSLLRALDHLGYQQPTDIQLAAIPHLTDGFDVTGIAQTGTGKTAAFGLPLLASIDPSAREVQALVLVPTRELAVQVADALAGFAAEMPAVSIVAIYGGAPMGRQISALRGGAQVVVGTPGRVIDLIDRRALKLGAVRFAVLDEADEMLTMGFAEDVDRILSEAPADRQTALFSATMPASIRRIAQTHLSSPVDVSVAASAAPVSTIDQSYVVLPYRDKAVALERILSMSDAEAAVVFVRTRSACDEVGTALLAAGVQAAVISGDVTQVERERTIARLRGGQISVLVATDVAARGMDVERIGLVVNFDSPSDPEIYTHRVGRTGRAGRSGQAITFFTPKETSRLRHIEKVVGHRLTEIDVPSIVDVRAHQSQAALAKAAVRSEVGGLQAYRRSLQLAAERTGVSVEDLAAALIATVIGDDGSAQHDVISHRRPEGRQERGERHDRGQYRHDRGDRQERGERQDRGDRQERGQFRHGSPSRGGYGKYDGPRGGRYAGKAERDRPDRPAGGRYETRHEGYRSDRPAQGRPVHGKSATRQQPRRERAGR